MKKGGNFGGMFVPVSMVVEIGNDSEYSTLMVVKTIFRMYIIYCMHYMSNKMH